MTVYDVWLRQIMNVTLISPLDQPDSPGIHVERGSLVVILQTSPSSHLLKHRVALWNIPDTGRLIKYWLPMIQNSSSRYPNWELASGIRFDYPFLGENRKNWIDIFHPPLHCSPNWHSDWPIRGQYFCHVTINDQSEASIYAHRGIRYHQV